MTGPRVDDRIVRERTVREALRRFRLELQQEVRTNAATSGVGDIRGPASSTDTAVPRFVGSSGKTLQNSGVLINSTNDITGANSLTVSTSLNSQTLAVGVVALNAAGDFTGIRSLTMSSGLNVGVSPDAFATELVRIGGDLLLGGYLQVIADEAQFLDALFGGTSHYYARMANSGGNLSWGVGHNTPGTFFPTSVANAGFISSQEDLEFIRNGVKRLGLTSTGAVITGTLAVSGAITGNLTGNASTATTLQTSRTLWGRSFNGSANVSGALSSVTTISMSSLLTFTTANATSIVINRTSSNMNSNIQYQTTSGSVWAGQGTANTFAVGSSADLTSSPWMTLTSTTLSTNKVLIGIPLGVFDSTYKLELNGNLGMSGTIQTYGDGEVFGTQVSVLPSFNARYIRIGNGNNNAYFGVGDETPGITFATSDTDAAVLVSDLSDIELIRAGTLRLAATATGVEIFGGLFLDGNAVGDVSGPAGAGDDAVPVFEGVTGKILRSSSVSISSIGHLTAPALTITGISTFTGNMTAGAITASGVNIGGDTGDATSILDLIGDLAISGRIRTYQDSGELFGTVTPIIPPGADIYIRIGDVTNEFYLGIGKASPDGTGFLRGTVGHAAVLHSASADIELIRSNTKRLWVTSAGVQVAGTLLVNGSPVGTGSGDVIGPASAVDNAIPRFDGTTGKLLQSSGVVITDSNTIMTDGIWIGSGFDLLSGEIVKIGTGGLQVADTVNIVTSTGDALVMTQFSTSHIYASLDNSGGDLFIGVGNVTPGTGFATSVAYAAFIDAANDIELIRAGVKRLGVTSAGVAITGTLLVNGSPVGSGDVTGPATANHNSLVRFDGSTGKLIKAGGPTVSDTGDITGVSSLTMTGALTGATTGAFSSNVTIGGTLSVTGLTTFTGGFKLANAAWLKWRNAANTLDYDVIRVTSGNAVVINAPPSSSIIQQLNGVDAATLDASGLTLRSAGPLTLSLVADTDNVTETDNPRLTFSQDAGAVTGHLGYASGTNALELMQNYADTLRFGTSGIVRMTLSASGDASFTGSLAVAGALTSGNHTITGRIAVTSANQSVFTFRDTTTAGNYGAWLKSDGTALAYIGGDGGAAVSGGVGNDFYIAAVAGNLGLTSAAGAVLVPGVGGLRVSALAGSGTRIVGADGTGNLVITALGSGDVKGPASSTHSALALFDGTTGKLLQNSGVSIISSNVVRASGYGIAGGGGSTTLGDSGTIDTSAGTWEITVSGGIITNILQLS